ncbi:AAA family ATPase [Salinigranum salinum]|uniref:AAA family ATPase n=1 Tax=Salinigranum salinum TaxID=1364937 RepID=UPI001F03CF00|nr:AAA family ATPase [Salinigranum salinum]
MPEVEMIGSSLDLSEIRELLIGSLGDSVKWHSSVENRPLELHLKDPLPSKVRLYLYNLVPSGREEEFKVNVRLPAHEGGDEDHAAPDRSGGYLTMLGGYHEHHEVFAFWDDDLHEEYGSVSPLQVQSETIGRAISEGLTTQQRATAGLGGETVIVAQPDRVGEAIEMRDRLIKIRTLLHEFLPDGWRDNGSRAQTIERVVDVFLEGTPRDRSTEKRREMAQQVVADDLGNTLDTVQDKFRGELWEDRDPGSEGYQRRYLDPILEEIESVWRDEETKIEELLEEDEKSDHPLIAYLEESEPTVSVYSFSAPPDRWWTSARYNILPFIQDNQEHWEEISPGDVVLFYSLTEPANTDLSDQSEGLIGAAILGEKYVKEDDWWWEEPEDAESFEYVARFDRVFYTGQIENINLNLGTETSDKEDSAQEEELEALTTDLLEVSKAHSICHNVFDDRMPDEEPLAAFTYDDGSTETVRPKALIREMASSLREAPPVNIYSEFSGSIDAELLKGLHFPDGDKEILDQIEAALHAGKHVILTGPPGTGKTEIARRVVNALAERYWWLYSGSQMTTATSDWSTFDTVGGYMPEEDEDTDGGLSFSPGIILNRYKDRETETQRNEPLVIDELNRADIDKAFGQLFTVLSGQSVQLPYTKDNKEVEIVSSDLLEELPRSHQYAVPESWVIFATMNTYDKTSLYEMSYAFMRRFSFIPIDVPELPEEDDPDEEELLRDLMSEYVSTWDGIDADSEEQIAVGRVWRNTNNSVDARAIGPAIVQDILATITQYPSSDTELEYRLTNAVISYIFPQLEGVPERRQIVNSIKNSPEVNEERIMEAAREILQVSFEDDE